MNACQWPKGNPLMQIYHDEEWCVPSYEDTYLFEMLILEGAQAGLSWSIVLAKREAYQKAFCGFDISYCANLTDEDLQTIKEKYNVIKNTAKLKSVRSNALAVEMLQKQFGSFSNYLWSYVDFTPQINYWQHEVQMPAESPLSRKISDDLKKRGFKFAGPVIIYSFMQAIGMIDDHIISCPYHSSNK